MKLIVVLIIVLQGCKTGVKKNIPTSENNNTISYPTSGLICFHQNGDGRRNATFKLGDSLGLILKLLDLQKKETFFDSILSLKAPLIVKSKYGTTLINVFAKFDILNRLKNFKAEWQYYGDTIAKARQDFYSTIMNYSIPCLWEEGPNIYNPVDTYRITSPEKHVTEFISDTRVQPWKVTYECRLK